jgi:hypothetical protein
MIFRTLAGGLKRKVNLLIDRKEDDECKRITEAYSFAGKYERIYTYHVRKTGGTSLNKMFLALSGTDSNKLYEELIHARCHRKIVGDKVYVGWNKLLIERGHYFYAYSHIPSHELALPENTYTITCLRDPVKRLVSHYKMLVEAAEKDSPPAWFHREKKWLGRSVMDFAESLPPEHLLNQLYMFSPHLNVDVGVREIMKCNIYFRTEEFDRGIARLNASINLNLSPMKVRSTNVQVELSSKMRKRLEGMLAPEYELMARLGL